MDLYEVQVVIQLNSLETRHHRGWGRPDIDSKEELIEDEAPSLTEYEKSYENEQGVFYHAQWLGLTNILCMQKDAIISPRARNKKGQ